MNYETDIAPDREVIVVTGIGTGEETKGNGVQFFTKRTHAHSVWRSGGFQATHNITLEDDREHSFRHLGAGTFEGANTYLKHMVINPAELFAEAQNLEQMGVSDPLIRLTIDKDCLTATEFHRAMSVLREILRGKDKKGTIGMGVGEAVRDSRESSEFAIRAGEYHDRETITRKLTAIRNRKLTEARSLIANSPLGTTPEAQQQLAILEDETLIEKAADSMTYLSDLTRIVDNNYLDDLLHQEGTIVTETSHGAFLDPWYGAVPHTTQVDPTSRDILATLKERNYTGKIVRLGVSRCYMTRHGAGPLVSYSPEMSQTIQETHNSAGEEWLGEFRNGAYDIVALRYGIDISGGKQSFDGLMISYLDELRKKTEWPVCEAYTYEGEPPADLGEFFDITDGRITGIRLHPNTRDQAHYQHQVRLTQLLDNCRPVITMLTPHEGMTLEQVFLKYAEEKLEVPVVAVAYGPKASDRKILLEHEHLFLVSNPLTDPEFKVPGRKGHSRSEQLFEKVQTIAIGMEGPIHEIDVTLENGKRKNKVGRMFIKGIQGPDRKKQTDGFSMFDKWLWLKNHEIPVVNTFRVNDEGNAVMMSDATEGGKYRIIDKHSVEALDNLAGIKNLEEIKQQVSDISRRAFDNGNGVFLSWESYAVLVDQNGIGKVMVLDSGALSFTLENGKAIREGSLFTEQEAERRAQEFIDTCLSTPEEEAAQQIQIRRPTGVDLYYALDKTTRLPKEIASNPKLLELAQQRQKLNQQLTDIFAKVSDPNMDVSTAVEKGLLTTGELDDTYSKLTKFLKTDENHGRIILYLPSELLPHLNSESGKTVAAMQFATEYNKAWLRLLYESEPRASYVDGDVLEEGIGPPPRVRKAGHLIPSMLSHGLITFSELSSLLEVSDQVELLESVTAGIVVSRDLNLVPDTHWKTVVDIASRKSEVTAVLTRPATAKTELNPDFRATLAAIEKQYAAGSTYITTMTPERVAWEKQERIDETIDRTAILMAQRVQDDTITIDDVFALHPTVGVKTIIMVGQQIDKKNTLHATTFAKRQQAILRQHWETGSSDVKNAIITGLSHWKRRGIIGIEYLDQFSLELPNLESPMPFDFENNQKADFLYAEAAAQKIQNHPVLSQYIYPIVIEVGSRVKGQAGIETDYDGGIVFKPETPWEKREEILQLLRRDIAELDRITSPLEFWLQQDNTGFSLKNAPAEISNAVMPQQIHFSLNSVWVGETAQVQQIRNSFLTKYLTLAFFKDNREASRKQLVRQLELDMLQYRLMHKGYRRFYPSYRTEGSAHANLIDWASDYWDPGYRRIATQLFVSRVFLPDLS